MTKEQYLKLRNEMMESITAMIGESKVDEANAKMKEVEELDAKFETITLANANLKALQDNKIVTDLENKGVSIDGGVQVATIEPTNALTEEKIYENAWAKQMMGQKIEGDELEVFDAVNKKFDNAYTHTTGNTGVLIPETVVAGIWSRAEEMYPLFADAQKFNVRGTLKIAKHSSIDEGDAAWYPEDTETADEKNTFGELILDGHELSKAVTVSWKLKAMAVTDFIPYIINELGERVGVALGKAAASGNGTTGPHGVETALLAESLKPQVVTYDPSKAADPVPLTFKMITEAISKVHSSYLPGAKFYTNNATIWTVLANLVDTTGRPYFIPDPTGQTVGRMLGFQVEADAGITAGHIVFGNANKGLIFNTNEPFSVVTEDHAKARTTDYVAYAVVDGDVLDTKAFALIQDIKTP
ncbi:phage major capsid protein [Sporosarcina sp. FSL K6-1522]|uniref:phage major capsid protein n=1 Tax=Sporosarcina sp. FSL K6-1522 TaxID=2921554 RepID=UPI00315AC6D2